MDTDNVQDVGKEIFNKIPDLAFDWYARLIPGFICAFLIALIYRIEIKLILDNFLFAILTSYIIGHLIQPFSSGMLQRKYKTLAGKKHLLLSKAYSELVGFFSCFLFTSFLLLFKFFDDLLSDHPFKFDANYLILIGLLPFFLLTVSFRKKAYDRKHIIQNGQKIEAVNPAPESAVKEK